MNQVYVVGIYSRGRESRGWHNSMATMCAKDQYSRQEYSSLWICNVECWGEATGASGSVLQWSNQRAAAESKGWSVKLVNIRMSLQKRIRTVCKESWKWGWTKKRWFFSHSAWLKLRICGTPAQAKHGLIWLTWLHSLLHIAHLEHSACDLILCITLARSFSVGFWLAQSFYPTGSSLNWLDLTQLAQSYLTGTGSPSILLFSWIQLAWSCSWLAQAFYLIQLAWSTGGASLWLKIWMLPHWPSQYMAYLLVPVPQLCCGRG
jgi:hypothetical protein